jgi:hypothetical protein
MKTFLISIIGTLASAHWNVHSWQNGALNNVGAWRGGWGGRFGRGWGSHWGRGLGATPCRFSAGTGLFHSHW